MLGADDSLNQDDVKEDLKMELALLNANMKALNPNWDFAPIINPLLSDQSPAMTVVPKLKKQIQRMTKVKDDFLKTRAAKSRAECRWFPNQQAHCQQDHSYRTQHRRPFHCPLRA